jgi:hypothetical protein
MLPFRPLNFVAWVLSAIFVAFSIPPLRRISGARCVPNRASNVNSLLRYIPSPKLCITRQRACDSCARRLLTAASSMAAEPSCAR